MNKKHLLLGLLVLFVAGCSANPGGLQNTPTPTRLPTPTVCASCTSRPASTPTRTPTITLTPSPTPTPGPEAWYRRLILIDQDTQTMHVYENGVQIRSIPCSTGKPGEETHTPAWEGEVGKYVGTFFAFDVYADDGWYLFDHYGGMLIHSAPYLIEDDVKVYQDLDALGVRPTSHGCIRLPPEEASWFTEWEPEGAHVIITPLTHSE